MTPECRGGFIYHSWRSFRAGYYECRRCFRIIEHGLGKLTCVKSVDDQSESASPAPMLPADPRFRYEAPQLAVVEPALPADILADWMELQAVLWPAEFE